MLFIAAVSGCAGVIGGDLDGVDDEGVLIKDVVDEQGNVGQCRHENEQRVHRIIVTTDEKRDDDEINLASR
jgi:hypothetical protein